MTADSRATGLFSLVVLPVGLVNNRTITTGLSMETVAAYG
jgi:hypothetical protein